MGRDGQRVLNVIEGLVWGIQASAHVCPHTKRPGNWCWENWLLAQGCFSCITCYVVHTDCPIELTFSKDLPQLQYLNSRVSVVGKSKLAAWVWIPALVLLAVLALGKLPNFSEPSFSCLKNEGEGIYLRSYVCGFNDLICLKFLEALRRVLCTWQVLSVVVTVESFLQFPFFEHLLCVGEWSWLSWWILYPSHSPATAGGLVSISRQTPQRLSSVPYLAINESPSGYVAFLSSQTHASANMFKPH